jgi:hypothetical protein
VLATVLTFGAGTSAWALPSGAGWNCVDHLLKEFAPSLVVKQDGQSAKKKVLVRGPEKISEQAKRQLSGNAWGPAKLKQVGKDKGQVIVDLNAFPVLNVHLNDRLNGQVQAYSNRRACAKTNREPRVLSKFQERAANCRSISGFIDYEEMSQRCLGKKDWEVLNASQKQSFTSTLQALVEKRYYPRWRKIFSKGSVSLLEETVQGKDILVRTRLKIGQKLTELSWRVVDDGGCAKVVSLAVADRDLLEKLKGRIQAHRKKGDFQSLLAWMNGKVVQASGSGATVSKLPTVPTAAFAVNNTSADCFTD